MDAKIFWKETSPSGPTLELEGGHAPANTVRHVNGTTDTEGPKPRRTESIKKLTWFACQAVKFNDPETKDYIELRSFPFFAFSLEHARQELRAATEKEGCPYTHIYQFASLHQEAGKMSKCKLEKDYIEILRGIKR